MSISPDSAVGQELQQRVKQHIAEFNLGEDIEDVSQYVVMLIGNDRGKDEMTGELQSLFGDKFTPEFSEWAYEEARKLVSGESGQEMDVVDQEQSGFGGYEATPVSAPAEQPRASLSLRQRIEGGGARGGVRGGGVGKGPRGGSARLGPRFGGNNRNLQAAVEKDVMSGQNEDGNNGGFKTQKERCRHWPRCSYPGCKFWHPIQPCFKFPNCPNPKGTCKYIHYGEDLPADNGMIPPAVPGQVPPQMPPVWPNGAGPGQFPPPQQVASAAPEPPKIVPCKYSEKCSNKECAYGHPTPANDNAKVSDNEWCGDKENCKNENCTKAHPSGSLVREPEKIPERVLETCKFLNKCTKMYCRYRHPVTTTICRNGADCQRVDCFFTHPFKEDCKFGINCKNSYCLYQHPPERDEMFSKPMVWVKNDNENQSNDTDMQQAENIQPRQQATS